MPVGLFNNVKHWLERAEKARVHAELLTDAEAKRMMLNIAESYERLARRAAERQLSAEPSKMREDASPLSLHIARGAAK
jgi:hypothetical protein